MSPEQALLNAIDNFLEIVSLTTVRDGNGYRVYGLEDGIALSQATVMVYQASSAMTKELARRHGEPVPEPMSGTLSDISADPLLFGAVNKVAKATAFVGEPKCQRWNTGDVIDGELLAVLDLARRHLANLASEAESSNGTPKDPTIVDQSPPSQVDPSLIGAAAGAGVVDDAGSRDETGEEGLSQRKNEILQALKEDGAVSQHKRLSAAEIAEKVEGKGANPVAFKSPLSELVRDGQLKVKKHRGGGYWLPGDKQS